MIHMRQFNVFEEHNVHFLVNKQINYATIQITATGLRKSIMDATAPVRAYLTETKAHNYENQLKGPEHKRIVETLIITETEAHKTQTSLYRPVTKNGDPRLWIYGISKYASADDIFVLITFKERLYVINLSRTDTEKAYLSRIENPVKDLVNAVYRVSCSVSNELLEMIRDRMSDWIPAEVNADTGIGRTVESLLGIPMNDSKQPDYKGIELKSKREKAKVRNNLFTQAPDWTLSKMKSSREIVERYGYVPDDYDHKALHVTLSSLRPNPQGLGLNIDYDKNLLEANEYDINPNGHGGFNKLSDVSVWTLIKLHERLLTKHHETFWIDVDSTIRNGHEMFRVTTIEHTKNPIPAQFDTLLEQGRITLDFLLGRNSGGDTYSFKISNKYRHLLFPESETYIING